MNEKNNIKKLSIGIFILIVLVVFLVLAIKVYEHTIVDSKEIKFNNEQEESNKLEEIKNNIAEYEKEWITNSKQYTVDSNIAKNYLDNVYNEFLRINKDNYREYFSTKLEYSSYLSCNVLEIGNLLTKLYKDILSFKTDAQTGGNTMKVFIDSFNNQYIEYLQNNSEVLFADSYTGNRALKYDNLQKKIQEGLDIWEDTERRS